uniref:Protein disulfide-isomerase n=1 Tax=Oncorhynchus kisutch TaxID=8019 RepID=A0A8C7IYC7_ONCKI
NMASFLLLIPAFMLSVVIFSGAVVARGDVLELGDADFDYLAAEHETMLVKFYAPWCGHCKKLAPDFETAASRLKGTVPLAKVDCTASPDTCGRFGVTGYPTLKIFRNGEDSSSYDGPRSADGIVHYMKKQAGPNSVTMRSEADVEAFVNHFDASVVGFFSGPDSAQLAEFLKAAGVMRDHFRFAHTINMTLVSLSLSYHSLFFISPSLFPSLPLLECLTLLVFLFPFVSFGMCPHLTNENRDKLKGQDLLTAYYDLDYLRNPKGSNYWRNRVMKVGYQFASQGLSFAVANRRDFVDELEEEFGLGASDGGDLPFVTIRTQQGFKYTMREEFTRDGKSLERFLEDYFAGRLKRYIKSEPIPEKNKGPVKVVVAESFEEIVNDPEKDVLIEFYAPWCGHCKSLEPKYKELAEQLYSDPNIVIAKMDATANDVPQGFDVQGFPTIYFARADKKDQPKRYEGAREVKDFIKYLKSEASHIPVVSGVREDL